MQKFILISIIISALFISGCANMHYNEGNRYYEALGYGKAIESYQKALSKKDIADAKRKLAISYRKLGNYKRAEEWYAIVVNDPTATQEDKVAYGQMLALNGKCEQAVDWLLKNSSGDPKSKLIIESCNAHPALMADSAQYSVEMVPLNDKRSDFSPVYYDKGIVFVSEGSSKDNKNISEYTGRPFLNLFYSELNNDNNFNTPIELKGEINSKYHEGPASFSPDKNTIYFTRNNYIKKKTKKSTEGIVNLKIYKAELTGGEWNKIESLPFNDDNFSNGHPAVTSDGKKMYFISDRPGGYGETDIYVSQFDGNSWSTPENLGLIINTPGREMFPYIFNDTILYFSSDGKTGMGGLDIYYSTLQNGNWSQPVNAGYPINSTADDFGFLADSTGFMGYFSSNRNSDSGIDNIYRFTKTLPFITLNGIVVDKETQLPLAGATVELINNKTGDKKTIVVGSDGTFSFQLDPKSEFKLSASMNDYFTIARTINTHDKDASVPLYEKFELEKIIVDKPIVIENIYYDFDKWEIRPDAALELDKFAAFLLDNPKIKVELSSHTDSRGSDEYNMTLSQKRAESAVQYLIKKGIPEDRITAMGYGESMLVNKCKNNVPCSAEEHQLNRRTEFKVTGFMAGGTELSTQSVGSENFNSHAAKRELKKEDVYYTVQIGAVLKNKSSDNSRFDSMKNIRKVEGDDNYIRYYVGKTKSFSEAQTIRTEFVSKGFSDAFITAFSNDEKISVKEAQEILKK